RRFAHSSRRARVRGTTRRSSSGASPCDQRRTRLRRSCPPRARRCWSRSQSMTHRMYARPMADVAAFRAVRYAHPTPDVTAPPYDVLTPALRDAYLARDPHNVVRLTLGASEEEGGRLYRTWLDEGVLVQDDEPAVWAVTQDYVGPDGVARRREGLVASLR